MRVLIAWMLGVVAVAVFAGTTWADAPVTAIALTPDGNLVLVGSQSGVQVRTWPELRTVRSLPTKLVHVHDLQFSPDGKTLLVAGGAPAQVGEVEVWSWPAGELVEKVTEHSDVVYRVAWSTDNSRWVSCGADVQCVFCDRNDDERVAYNGHSQAVSAVCWLDDQTMASVSVDQTVRVWKAESGAHVRTMNNHVGCINDLAMRPVDQQVEPKATQPVIATASEDRTVRLWQPRIGRLMRFVRLNSAARRVLWSSDGNQLFVGCSDGMVYLLNWETLEIVKEWDGRVGRIHEMTFDNARAILLVGGENGFQAHKVNETDSLNRN